jgi:hypothetical protein
MQWLTVRSRSCEAPYMWRSVRLQPAVDRVSKTHSKQTPRCPVLVSLPPVMRRFLFDGDDLAKMPTETPESMDMEDDMMIDVKL